jgi:hypothetical protein
MFSWQGYQVIMITFYHFFPWKLHQLCSSSRFACEMGTIFQIFFKTVRIINFNLKRWTQKYPKLGFLNFFDLYLMLHLFFVSLIWGIQMLNNWFFKNQCVPYMFLGLVFEFLHILSVLTFGNAGKQGEHSNKY